MGFKWEKGGYRPVVKDGDEEVIVIPNDADKELIEMIKETAKNMKCGLKSAEEPIFTDFKDEPRFEDKDGGIMRVAYGGSMLDYTDMFEILVDNGYEIHLRLEALGELAIEFEKAVE